MAPLATVGITCFNARDTIARAIASALAQDWPATEIIVVDDVSSDGSRELLREIAAQNASVRVVLRETNGGPASARNEIVRAARGEFIAFFDDDDEALPGRVREQIDALQAAEGSHPSGLIACYAGGVRHYPNGHVKPLPAIGSEGELLYGPAVADYLLFNRRVPGWFYGSGTPTAALLARTSTFRALDGFDERLRRVEDVDLAIRLALRGGAFVGTREPLFVQHATLGSDKTADMNYQAEVALAEKHRPYLKSVGRAYYATRWPRVRYHYFRREYARMGLVALGILIRHPIVGIKHLVASGSARLAHDKKIAKAKE